MFKEVLDLISIEMISNKNCEIKSMISAFEGCRNLKEIAIKGFDTSKVSSINKLFYNTGLKLLNLSDINTTNVIDMSYTFVMNPNIEKLDLYGIDTKNVKNMEGMFQFCSSISDLNVSNFNIENVLYMNNMFYYCTSLTSLDLKNFKTNNVVNMESMFKECLSLKKLIFLHLILKM